MYVQGNRFRSNSCIIERRVRVPHAIKKEVFGAEVIKEH